MEWPHVSEISKKYKIRQGRWAKRNEKKNEKRYLIINFTFSTIFHSLLSHPKLWWLAFQLCSSPPKNDPKYLKDEDGWFMRKKKDEFVRNWKIDNLLSQPSHLNLFSFKTWSINELVSQIFEIGMTNKQRFGCEGIGLRLKKMSW